MHVLFRAERYKRFQNVGTTVCHVKLYFILIIVHIKLVQSILKSGKFWHSVNIVNLDYCLQLKAKLQGVRYYYLLKLKILLL